MKLFYCTTCKRYYRSVLGTVSVFVQADIHMVHFKDRDSDLGVAFDSDYTEIPLGNVAPSAFTCYKCDKPSIVIANIEPCPHDWKVGRYNDAVRECQLCGKVERGRVTFPSRKD